MPNFSSRDEAIQYYRQEEESLKDMPDYLIGVLIDFSKKYDNYDEYLAVEEKVQNNKPLTKREQKKYGHLSFEKVHVTHPKNAVIHDHITTQDEGHFDDLRKEEVFEKYNKYGIDFPKTEEPNDTVKFELKDEVTHERVIIEKSIDEIRNNPDDTFKSNTWDIKEIIKPKAQIKTTE